jgi:hypothetical protein
MSTATKFVVGTIVASTLLALAYVAANTVI